MFYNVFNKITQKLTTQHVSKLGYFLLNNSFNIDSLERELIFKDGFKLQFSSESIQRILNNFNYCNFDASLYGFRTESIKKALVNFNTYGFKQIFCCSYPDTFLYSNVKKILFFSFIDENFEIFDLKWNKITNYQDIIDEYRLLKKKEKIKGRHKYRKGVSFRKIRTTNERRQNAYVCKEDLEPPIRLKRRTLPNAYCDIITVYSACWKDQTKRRRQYKLK